MKTKNPKVMKSQFLRILMSLSMLAIVTAITVVALDNYDTEHELDGCIGLSDYIYQLDESCIDYASLINDYGNQGNYMYHTLTNSSNSEYGCQPGYLGYCVHVEGDYDVGPSYNYVDYGYPYSYPAGNIDYLEDEYGNSGYIGYAPDYYYSAYYENTPDYGLEYYYVKFCDCHSYVRRYISPYGPHDWYASAGDAYIQAYGGYIGIAPFSIPTLPPLPTMPSDMGTIIDVPISVTTVSDIQTAVNWIIDNGSIGNAYRILLNFPGNQAIGTTTINFNSGHYTIIDSYNNYNQVWLHHGTGRHFSISSGSSWAGLGGTTVELRDVTLSRNLGTGAGTIASETIGGGVNVGNGRFFMNHERATISNNRAAGGGAILLNPYIPTVRFWLQAGQIEYNVSTFDAGAIWSDGVGVPLHIVMTGGYIRHNIAYGAGGAFAQCCWTWYWVDGTYIYGNISATGGGAFILGGATSHMYMLSGEIHDNTTFGNGGGILSGSNLALVGGYIHNNQAISNWPGGGNGGGVYASSGWGNVRIFGGSITNNQASGDGGGIRLSGVDTWDIVSSLNISGNRVGGNGGGISFSYAFSWVVSDIMVLCDRVTITNNTAGGNGGGIFFDEATPDGVFNPILQGSTISGNGHVATVHTHGGGIFPNINITPVDINTQNGGGVYIAAGRFRIDYGNITGNAALGTGNNNGFSGAVHASAPDWGTSSAFIYMHGPGTINLNNNDARMGGAMRLAGTSNFNQATNTGPINLIGNTATQLGGALSLENRTTANAINLGEDWTISQNTAGISGGGIHMRASTLTINGTIITNNEVTGTTSGGGGVYVGGFSTFTINPESLIAYNTAYTGGGVLFHGASIPNTGIIMHGGTIRNNTATSEDLFSHGGGGVAFLSDSIWDFARFVMHDGYIINNTSYSNGGGVSANSEALFEMNNGSISGNTARRGGGIYVASLAGETVWLPHPPWQAIVPRAVVISGGEISNNQATTTPTAQYIAREVDPTTGAVITPGLYNGSGGGIYVVRDAGITIENTNITNNHAYEMGGGIFTEWYQYYVPTLTEVDVYTNLIVADTVTFDDNTAGQGDFLPPTNAYDWTNIPGLLQGGDQSIHDHPINNYDINFRRAPVTTIPFTFHKTTSNVYTAPSLVNIADITPFLLEGAYFSLFRFEGSGTPPDLVTYPSADWERIYNAVRSTGLLTDPITMELTPDGIYHLVETLAPAGFQIPFGQWRITHDDNAPGDFTIITVGGTAPCFEYLDGYFHVGNVPGSMLPLTGGFATHRILWAGSLALLAGFGMWAYLNFFANKKREAQ